MNTNVASGQGQFTLMQWAKTQGYGGAEMRIIDTLSHTNEVLQDIPFEMGDTPTGMMVSVMAGYPEVVWTDLYDGVMPTTGTFQQVEEKCGHLSSMSEVGVKVAMVGGNPARKRRLAEKGHIQSMGIEFADAVFYGNSKRNPNRIMGLSPRYDDLDADNADNIIDAGGKAGNDLRSIWVVCWGDDRVTGMFPQGMKAGLTRTDHGKQWIDDASMGGQIANRARGRLEVYRTSFEWDIGLCVKDWRYIVRICNIPADLLDRYGASSASATYTDSSISGTATASGATATGAVNLPDLFDQALERLPMMPMSGCYAYMDRQIESLLARQHSEAVKGSVLNVENVGSYEVTKIRGVALRRCDALFTDEEQVT